MLHQRGGRGDLAAASSPRGFRGPFNERGLKGTPRSLQAERTERKRQSGRTSGAEPCQTPGEYRVMLSKGR